ncbi:sn-glycerol-3-phosphate ABC transporter ATP-binding protein UgpC [Oligoflexaceae bacterium]|nr:sn-glycerol-3-phosphate ABC transporter ATP-binding protein UgpC [Oligoflexaceae bacterium]
MSAGTVELRNLEKLYGETKILNDLSFSVESGEFIVLVGPSGCGKSTLLRCLAGLEAVNSGQIFIGGEDRTTFAPKDRNIAMVFQDYALYPHKTVYENIAFGLRIRKLSEDEIDLRVREATEKLGLEDYLQRKPKDLSGGQRQRVAIGRAIVRKPEVFLFDEPLSNLDAKLRGQMRIRIAKLHRELKTTAVYVTHDQTEAMTLATRIIVLNKGCIQQQGAPLDLYEQPANEFVAQFIGSPAMNLIAGQLRVESDALSFHSGADFKIPLPQKFLSNLQNRSETRDIRLGLRPECLSLTKETADLSGTVEVIEPLGSSTQVICHVSGEDLHVNLQDGYVPKTGEAIGLKYTGNHLYAFDQKNGLNILLGN